jgi:hypothetical protein
MAADVSAITYFAPIAAFLLVFIISYAIFAKIKILGENQFVNIFVSFLIATVFVATAGARQYVQMVIPWIAILLVALVFVLAITFFVGKGDVFAKGIGIVFLALFGLVFIISAFVVFSNLIVGYLPGPLFGYNTDPNTAYALSWLYSPRVSGAILLIAISAVVSWILVKAK